MERENIKLKVLQCIDEVNPQSLQNYGLAYPIDAFLEEAGRELLRMAPLSLFDRYYDFSDAAVVSREDGSGWVMLPSGFISLVSFQMEGWQRPATKPLNNRSKTYNRQFNKITRGGVAKPVVVLDGDKLFYYSLPQGAVHKVLRADAIIDLPVGDEYPEKLIDALAWLAASKILIVMSEAGAAVAAKEQFLELLALSNGQPERVE